MKKAAQLLWLSYVLLFPTSVLADKKEDGYCALVYYAKTIDQEKEVKICEKTKTIEYRFGTANSPTPELELRIKKSDLYRGNKNRTELFIPHDNTWYVLTIDKYGSYIKIYDAKNNDKENSLLSLFNIIKLDKSSQINNIENLKEVNYR